MIVFQENVDLRPFNTFGISANARYFCRLAAESDVTELLRTSIYRENRILFLGGGSNVLFRNDFDGLVVKNELKGISIEEENDQEVTIKVASGEVWDELVMLCVSKNWGGIENLALIPGTVGAAPMQNIGAYGVEVRNVITKVEAINRENGEKRLFTNSECDFAYRESIFKRALREKFFISSVTLRLTKKNHSFNTSYGALQDVLKQQNESLITLASIRDAVMRIRKSKLPDPTVIGNAGSFFKNPTIALSQFEKLKNTFPEIPGYSIDNQNVKVPAGWLIESCQWKGKRVSNAGVHDKQALVLVNYKNASGDEIFSLATQIQRSVSDKFDIALEMEVNIVV